MDALIKNGYTTVKDFADKKGITPTAVYLGIKRGKYESKKLGSLVLVRE